MKLKQYIKDQIVSIVLYCFMVVLITWMLFMVMVPGFIIVISMIVIITTGLIIFIYNFHKKESFYNPLVESLSQIDQKYLVHELIKIPDNNEGLLLYSIIEEIDRSTTEYLNSYRYMLDDFKEYLELWIHEIKIPLASARLIVENNKDTISANMIEELNRVENLVEQVLFYVRSENVEKDYSIKECNLNQIVKEVVKSNRRAFIYKKIALQLESLEINVLTDAKWMIFILNQIINNSLKYSKEENAYIKISATKHDNNVFLKIEDNGIGISNNDLPRVFEKGFTGENGRKSYNSTGIGLYLCKKLCEKLHHQISIQSALDQGTCMTIGFPIGSYSNIIKN